MLSFIVEAYKKSAYISVYWNVHKSLGDEDAMSRKMRFWVVMLLMPLLALAGCTDLTGAGSSQSQNDKPARDIDEQVDAAVKEFKNE